MQKITPCLWFNTQAEEAAKFYDKEKASKAMNAMLQMKKTIIADLEKAVEQK